MASSTPTSWLQATPFAKDLGIQAMTVTSDTCRFILPFSVTNTFAGAVHGGALAALAALCNHAMMRAGPATPDAAPSLASLHIAYLRPAKTQSTWVESRSMGRSEGQSHFETKLLDHDGKLVAQAFGTGILAPATPGTTPSQEPVTGQRDTLSKAVAGIPFAARRAIRVEAAAAGRVELSLAAEEVNLDADKTVHEGAVAALVESAGAAAAWSLDAEATPRGSTLALQLSVGGRLPAALLRARAAVRLRAGSLVWVDVDVLTVEQRLVARGAVTYTLPALPTG